MQVNPKTIEILLCLGAEIGKVKTTDHELLMPLLLLTLDLSLPVLLSSLLLNSLFLVEPLSIERPNSFSQRAQKLILPILQGAELLCVRVLVFWTDLHQVIMGECKLLLDYLALLPVFYQSIHTGRPILS